MKLEKADDIELYDRALAGDESAFTALYRRWQRSIYRFSLRMTGSASMAEDIMQEVFLALINSNAGQGFDRALGSFASYLYGIARNHALRRLSRERSFEPISETTGDTAGSSHEQPGAPGDPFGMLTRRETFESLHRAIAALPLHYREVVVLCELQELSYLEVAAVVGCPEGTVRSRLHRARVLLLEKIRDKSKDQTREPVTKPARCLS